MMHATPTFRSLSVLLLALAGCSKPDPVPGVTYNASAVTRGADGKLKQEGAMMSVSSAVVNDVAEVVHEGRSISVQVQKTSYGKAAFQITFPDKSTQKVQVKSGDTKDVLPRGQKVGVRIEVQEAH